MPLDNSGTYSFRKRDEKFMVSILVQKMLMLLFMPWNTELIVLNTIIHSVYTNYSTFTVVLTKFLWYLTQFWLTSYFFPQFFWKFWKCRKMPTGTIVEILKNMPINTWNVPFLQPLRNCSVSAICTMVLTSGDKGEAATCHTLIGVIFATLTTVSPPPLHRKCSNIWIRMS